jgi:hypothetical protein
MDLLNLSLHIESEKVTRLLLSLTVGRQASRKRAGQKAVG